MPFHIDDLGVQLIEFGNGDIFMFNGVLEGYSPESVQLIVFQDARVPGPIGERPDKNIPDGTEEHATCMETKLKMVFNNTDSIDQLLGVLLHARCALQGFRTSTSSITKAIELMDEFLL